jgi:hypothetical protein
VMVARLGGQDQSNGACDLAVLTSDSSGNAGAIPVGYTRLTCRITR